MKIILASQSPRRKELLTQLGYSFETCAIACEEVYPSNLPLEEIAAYLSELKSSAYGTLQEDEVLITADTIVAINGSVLGKPSNRETAKEMLKLLSGNTHKVYTAVSVTSLTKKQTRTDTAAVEFDVLSEKEIDYYLDRCAPYDKAGSYGVQDWLGMAKIKKIDGSFYTIMGLPTHVLYTMLSEFEAA